jgi:uncharacterized low-complexity protein
MMRRFSLRLLTLAFLLSPVMSAFGQDAGDKSPAEKPAAKPAPAPAEAAPNETEPAAEPGKREIPLNVDQQALANRFERFQKTMRKMAEQMRSNDPERADLLLRAISRSQEDRVVGQMRIIEQLLTRGQFGDSVTRQEDLLKNLHVLLDLLQSENRLSEIDAERKRLQGLLRDVNKLVGKEKDARAINERGGNSDRASDKQDDVKDETEGVIKKIDAQDAEKAAEGEPGEGKPGEGKPGEGKPGEGKPEEGKPGEGKPEEGKPGEGKPEEGKPEEGKPEEGKPEEGKPEEGKPEEGKPEEGKPGEGKPGEGKPEEGKPEEGKPEEGKPEEGKPEEGKPEEGKPEEGKPGEGKPGEGKPKEGKPGEAKPGEAKPGEAKPGEGKPGEGKPGEGKPGEGKPGEGKPGEGKPGDANPDQTPGREELEKARDEMQKAIDELRKKNRDRASRHQDEAIRELLEAKEKLEEILRQLREEEKKLMLAALEARFRKMLGMQLLVYQDTVRLNKSAKPGDATLPTRARQLARSEEEIVTEVDKALILLREEGSSVAFPEAALAIREDMVDIVGLLDGAKTGELTQTLEQSVIEALEEMVDALQKEMEKQKEQEQKESKPQEGQPRDKPLVDALAELKMLRSLQLRVNRRTRQLGRMIEGDQAGDPDLLDQLQTLSRRQARIQQATYDLATGKNK